MSDAGNQPSTPSELTELILDGRANPDQIELFRELIRQEPAALAGYLDQVRIHALMQWRHGAVHSAVQTSAEDAVLSRGVRANQHPSAPIEPQHQSAVTRELSLKLPRSKVLGRQGPVATRRWPAIAAAAALIIVTGLAAILLMQPRGSHPPSVSVAEVIESDGVVWDANQSSLAVGSRIVPGTVSIRGGTLRLRSNTGAVMTLTGRSQLRIVTDMRVVALLGRITVRVGEKAHGFTVESPGGDVVDLGTEFGVQVSEQGQTDVVVFEGQIDLTRKPGGLTASSAATQPLATRLSKGEGLHIDATGTASPVAAVARRPGAAEWAVSGQGEPGAVISAVRDNRHDPEDSKYYQIVRRGLSEDAPAYVDRSYEWNGVTTAGMPPELIGADLVMTFNSDKTQPDLQVTLVLARPASVYIFNQSSAALAPDWLRRDFVDTGLVIGMDEGAPDMPNRALGRGPGQSIDHVFRVWRRDVKQAGSITLGINSHRHSMYGIAAAPLP